MPNDPMTNNPVLCTKFFIPPFREEYINRPHLIQKINGGVKRKLVIIVAPAGYGKSTIMSEWTTQTKLPFAWLSLDKTHNDPFTFCAYLIASLQSIFPALGENLLAGLNSSTPPPVMSIITGLVNELSLEKRDTVLMLDDLHNITNPNVVSLLSALVFNQPPRLHLIIASRFDIPFSYARLRTQGEVISLRIDELRFTPQEVSVFLRSRLGNQVSANQETEILNRTEGWITGLQMAVLFLQSRENTASDLTDFSGQDRFVTDYLIDEVLARQNPEIYQFLLKTSILDKLSAPLCDWIMDIRNSQDLIEHLYGSGLFIIPLDNTHTWFRYHHLFAELLYSRLEEHWSQEIINGMRLKAAKWFFDHRLFDEAVEQSLNAKDYLTVIEYLLNSCDEILANGRFAVYLEWLEQIPDSYLVQSPKLVLYRVFQLWEMGNLDGFHRQMALAERMLGPLPEDLSSLSRNEAANQGILAVIKGIFCCGNYEIERAAPYFQQAQRLLPENLPFWRVLSLGAAGFCERIKGNYAEAAKQFSQVMELAPQSGLTLLYFMYSLAQVMVYQATGQLTAALECCRKTLNLDRKQRIPFAGLTYSTMGDLLYHTGDLTAAELDIQHGIELVTQDGDVFSLARAFFTLSKIRIAQGDPAGAVQVMDEMMRRIGEMRPPRSTMIIARSYQAYVWINCSQLSLARQWAANPGIEYLPENNFPEILGSSYYGVYCTIQEPYKTHINFIRFTLARLEYASGNYQKAIEILHKIRQGIAQDNNTFIEIQILILTALALAKQGNEELAVERIIEIFQRIAPEPFCQIFIDEGKSIQPLLEKARVSITLAAGDPVELARMLTLIDQVLLRLPKSSRAPSCRDAAPTCFDLTPREIDVLNLLASGISYEETAAALTISMNTVKTHLKRIYSKLEVSNRLQAVNKAEKLGLISKST